MMVLTRTQQRAQDANNPPHPELSEPDAPSDDSPPDSRPTPPESSQADEEEQISEWQGLILPRFEIPQWRKRNGVPTIVLRPIEPDAFIGPTNGSDNELDDVGTDSQSDHTISDDSDAPASDQDDDDDDDDDDDGLSNPQDFQAPQDSQNPRDPRDPQEPQGSREPQNPQEPQDPQVSQEPQEHQDPKGPQIGPLPKERSDDDEDVYPESISIEGLPIGGLLSDLEVERYGERVSRFIHSPFGPEDFLGGGWHAVKLLGRGSFGMVGVWERRDENNKTIDSVAVKQINRDKRDETWDDSRPLEVDLMKALLTSKDEENNVVQLKGYRRYRRHEVHRIYMEYCQRGDLQKLIEQYRERCDRGDESTKNILGYPEVKIGDFGVGQFTGVADKRNPAQLRGPGTPGYKALEMETFDKDDMKPQKLKANPHIERAYQRHQRFRENDPQYRHRRPKLLAHTNIWGIGAVMCDLMILKPVKRYLYNKYDISYDDDAYEEATVCMELEEPRRYHSTLTDYALRCIHPDPSRRPTASELIAALESLEPEWGRKYWYGPDAGQEIPWGNFNSLKRPAEADGDHNESDDEEDDDEDGPVRPWRGSTGIQYHSYNSSIYKTTGEKRKWSEDRPARQAKRARVKEEKQRRKDLERQERREEGEKDVSSREVSSPPNTGRRKEARRMNRKGEWTGWWRKQGYREEPRGFLS
ncbi:MAG: hypothetical protein Q9182_001551 [Xanthomendoza sp. 2 TL-2023]